MYVLIYWLESKASGVWLRSTCSHLYLVVTDNVPSPEFVGNHFRNIRLFKDLSHCSQKDKALHNGL